MVADDADGLLMEDLLGGKGKGVVVGDSGGGAGWWW